MKPAWAIPAALSLTAWVAATASAQDVSVYTGNLGQRAPEYVPDRVIVGFAEPVTDEAATQLVAGLGMGASLRPSAPGRSFRVLSVPKGRVFATLNALRKSPRVRYAHPDWIVHALQVPPNDPLYSRQWNLQGPGGSIRAEGAWAVNPGGDPGVVVAVVDTGIAYETFGSYCQAPDLAGQRFVPGWDFVNGDAHANDDESHGTHVAGTIAQATGNALGVAGIAYNVSLMPVKALGANGSGSVSGIADGIRWAADHGAHVINMSFGTTASPALLTALQEAIEYAASRGVVLVAASGNSSGASPMYPAAYPEVISVGATLYSRALAGYSNRGNELCAPGGTNTGEDLSGVGAPDMILQNTFDPNTHAVCSFGYWFFAGTSMAAPHVAALAALVKSENPALTAAEIRQALRDTADPSVTDDCGFGLVDATRLLEAVRVGDKPPLVGIADPTEGSMVFGRRTIEITASDAQTPPADLVVEWSRDGTTWAPALLNPTSGRYEASWDTTAEVEDSQLTLRARARDSAGQTTTAAPVTVKVNNSNQPPAAAFSYTCSANVCDFDASATTDPDGSAFVYGWSFGNGQSGSGRTVRHTFAATGTYLVALTVTDELGATGTTSENVTISQVNNTIHVSDLDRSSRRLFLGFWEARITIRIADTLSSPVSGVRVTGLFNDGPSPFQCTTGPTGSCSVVGYQWQLPCLTFTVTGAAHATLRYDPALNADPDGDSSGTQITVCRP